MPAVAVIVVDSEEGCNRLREPTEDKPTWLLVLRFKILLELYSVDRLEGMSMLVRL